MYEGFDLVYEIVDIILYNSGLSVFNNLVDKGE